MTFALQDKINWELISKAVSFYESIGYKYIEVPWIVSQEAIQCTYNGDVLQYDKNRCVVGSAEQSFIQMILDKKLPRDNYVTVTPCFRNDPVDEYHYPYFLKVELIRYGDLNLDRCCEDAKSFFETMAAVYVIETNEGLDINLNDIEIGSYGIRKLYEHSWVYGTGLAEPRFSKLMNKTKER